MSELNEHQKLVAGFVRRGQVSFARPLTEDEITRIYERNKKNDKNRPGKKPRRVCPFPELKGLTGNAYKRKYAELRRREFAKRGLTTAGTERILMKGTK